MKILYFDDFKLGVLKQDGVVDVTSVVKAVPHLATESCCCIRQASSSCAPFWDVCMRGF